MWVRVGMPAAVGRVFVLLYVKYGCAAGSDLGDGSSNSITLCQVWFEAECGV